MNSAAVLSIGTELTRGELVNTNVSWLSERMTLQGLKVLEHATVDDDVARIAGQLRRLAATFDWVICTGGLGPTSDDCTAVAAAQAFDMPLRRDGDALDHVRAYLARFGREMKPAQEKQADLPREAIMLRNPAGTAPGFFLTAARAQLFFLPGVPREMQAMYAQHIAPKLDELPRPAFAQRRLRFFGIGEGDLQQRIHACQASVQSLTLRYRATFPEVVLTLSAFGQSHAEAEHRVDEGALAIRREVGDFIYAEGTSTLPELAAKALQSRGLSAAISDGCTCGYIGSALAEHGARVVYLEYAEGTAIERVSAEHALVKEAERLSAPSTVGMALSAWPAHQADGNSRVGGSDGPALPIQQVAFVVAVPGYKTQREVHSVPDSPRHHQRYAAYFGLRLLLRTLGGA